MKNMFLGKRRARGWVHTVRQWEEGVEMMLERTCPDHQEARERSHHVGGGLSEEAKQGQKDNPLPTHTPSCGDHGLGCGVMAGARYRFNSGDRKSVV